MSSLLTEGADGGAEGGAGAEVCACVCVWIGAGAGAGAEEPFCWLATVELPLSFPLTLSCPAWFVLPLWSFCWLVVVLLIPLLVLLLLLSLLLLLLLLLLVVVLVTLLDLSFGGGKSKRGKLGDKILLIPGVNTELQPGVGKPGVSPVLRPDSTVLLSKPFQPRVICVLGEGKGNFREPPGVKLLDNKGIVGGFNLSMVLPAPLFELPLLLLLLRP